MIKVVLKVDDVVTLKLLTGEEIVVKVTAFDEDFVQVRDARTVAITPNKDIGLMNTFVFGGELQQGTFNRSNIAGYGVLSAEMEKAYLSEVSGIDLKIP